MYSVQWTSGGHWGNYRERNNLSREEALRLYRHLMQTKAIFSVYRDGQCVFSHDGNGSC